jgi:hypothetical protein
VHASCVAPGDADGDGDVDLFIGGRVVPGAYGMPAKSYLLLNDGKGRFETTDLLPQGFGGLVTDAQWIDLSQDGEPELVICGEWMNITVLARDAKGSFTDVSSQWGLLQTSGLWNCLESADFDNDGDIDLVAGNLGLNSRLKAGNDQPVKLYVGDIDNNGSMEQILTYYNEGVVHPFVSRDQLVKQVPPLKRKFLHYLNFRDVKISDIISPDLQRSFRVDSVTMLASVYLENLGSSFKIRPLPFDAQISPVFSMLPADLNRDGFQDIVGGGNLYAVQPEFGRYDAGYGFVLLNDQAGGFRTVQPAESGFIVRGEVRDIKKITTPDGDLLVVGRNNDEAVVFKIK